MKSDLSKTLRKIIREEVETAVRQEFVNFVSLIGEANTPKKKVVKPKKKVVSETSIKKLVNDIVPKKKQTIKKHNFTSNSVLNNILNETAGGIPPDGSVPPQPQAEEEWPTMGGGVMDKSKMASVLGYGDVNPLQGMTGTNGQPVNAEDDKLVNALTRDYGDLMKAIEKKKSGSPLKG